MSSLTAREETTAMTSEDRRQLTCDKSSRHMLFFFLMFVLVLFPSGNEEQSHDYSALILSSFHELYIMFLLVNLVHLARVARSVVSRCSGRPILHVNYMNGIIYISHAYTNTFQFRGSHQQL